MEDGARLSRRASLAKLGGLLAGAVAVGGSRVADSIGATNADAQGDGPAAVASGAVACVLAPEQTEGPYYLDDARVRRNITEGKAGVPLALRLTVVDASSCKPIKGAAVDVWHCDAGGVYSGTSVRARRTTASCAASNEPTRRVSRSSAPSIQVGIRVGRSTSTSWFTWAETSYTRASSTSPTL